MHYLGKMFWIQKTITRCPPKNFSVQQNNYGLYLSKIFRSFCIMSSFKSWLVFAVHIFSLTSQKAFNTLNPYRHICPNRLNKNINCCCCCCGCYCNDRRNHDTWVCIILILVCLDLNGSKTDHKVHNSISDCNAKGHITSECYFIKLELQSLIIR